MAYNTIPMIMIDGRPYGLISSSYINDIFKKQNTLLIHIETNGEPLFFADMYTQRVVHEVS